MCKPYRLVVAATLLAALTGCGGGGSGGTTGSTSLCQGVGPEVTPVLGLSGPGDTSRLFPLTAGNLWQYRVSSTDGGMVIPEYGNTVSVATSQLVVNGQNALDVDESNVDGMGSSIVTTMVADANGIAAVGGHDPIDLAMIPRWVARLPIQAGSEFVQINRQGIILQGDLDGDGLGEILDVCSIVRVLSPEDLTVPAGTYEGAIRMQTETRLAVRGSASGQSVTGTGTETVWLAPGVGPIRRLSTGTFDGVGFVSDEELSAYFVDGIANNLEPATTDLVTGNLEAGTSRSWYFENPPVDRSTVALTGLTGRARLEVGSCRTEGGGPGPDNSFIQCTVAPSQGPLVVQVQGIEATPFVLSLGANPLVSTPVSESKDVSLAIPTPGQVATRGESWYSTSVTPGTYGVYVLGASGDVNLHVYGSGYPMESDCTRWAPYTYPARWSCVLQVTGGTLVYSVASGPVNRDGASYLLLVHPMP